MSVPPEIEASCMSDLMPSRTKTKPSGDSGEPVEVIRRRSFREWVSIGRNPALRTESMNFAEVPNRVMPSASA